MSKRQTIKLWQAPDLGNVELLYASYKKQTFAPHFHKTYSIGIVETQAMTFKARGDTHVVSPGYIGVNNPGVVHTGSSVTSTGWTYRNLYPSAETLASLAAELESQDESLPSFPSAIYDPELATMFLNLHRDLEVENSKLERQSRYQQLLSLLILRHADARYAEFPIGREHRAVQRGLTFIQEHLRNNITVDELANYAGLSASQFTRVFKARVGLPPHLYQTQLRGEQAKRLLNQGQPIVQVAFSLGFSDQSHLTRKFKALFGVTPGQYVSGL